MARTPDLPPESPAGHLRNALALLGGVEARLADLVIPPDEDLTALLQAARARIWRALNRLEQPADAPRWWLRLRRLARRRGWLTDSSAGGPTRLVTLMLVTATLGAACHSATALRVATIHVGNDSPQAVAVWFRPAGSGPALPPGAPWVPLGTVLASRGQCFELPAAGPTVLLADGGGGATVRDSTDLSAAADWAWDVDVARGLHALTPIPTVCG